MDFVCPACGDVWPFQGVSSDYGCAPHAEPVDERDELGESGC